MNKRDLVKKYRDNNQEIDLIENLEFRNLREYNNEYISLLEVLFLMLDETEKNHSLVQQMLFKYIYSALDKILESEEARKKFVNIISSAISFNNHNVSSFIFRFILNIKDNVEGIGDKTNINVLKADLEQINIDVLDNAIGKKKEYNLIRTLFYNCATDMESNRKVVLRTEAIQKFHNYIEENPIEYLRHFIRPYYTNTMKGHIEYFLHVGEPFCNQIFPEEVEFIEYLNKAKRIDEKLVADIKMFFESVIPNSNERGTLILYSSEIKTSSSKEQYKKLLSSSHVWVRPECLPPSYKSKKS